MGIKVDKKSDKKAAKASTKVDKKADKKVDKKVDKKPVAAKLPVSAKEILAKAVCHSLL